MIPYISKLTQEELNELAQKGTDSTYISDFTFKMKSQLDIEKEFERFFSKGVQSEKKENSSQQKINPMDVTDLFERYMGLKR